MDRGTLLTFVLFRTFIINVGYFSSPFRVKKPPAMYNDINIDFERFSQGAAQEIF